MKIGPVKIPFKVPEVAVSALRAYGRATYPLVRSTAEPMLRRMFSMHPEGLEHVPRHGPAIITPNHLSFLDPFFIAVAIPRHVTFIGKAEYWDNWSTRWFFELAGGIPVRRDDSIQAHGSLEAGKEVLRDGHVLGIFPEGTRSPDGRLYKGKTGAARMALEVGCPVIPAGLVGTEKVLPKDATVPTITRVGLRFGRPRSVPQEAADDPHLLRVFTDDLMADIAKLSGQTYRHRYAYRKRMASVEAPIAISFTA